MRVVDLFSGCGGLSLGFQNAGFNVVAAYDNWHVAVDCYNKNFSHPAFQLDLTDSAAVARQIVYHKAQMIVGGPPCQDFSHAGGRTEGTRANLTQSFAEVVSKCRPDWFVMENVDRARTSKAYSKARAEFRKFGYGLTEKTIDASFCGVPQKRKRFFVVGHLGDVDDFLSAGLELGLSSKPMTIRKYLGKELGIEHYYRHPRNYSRRAVFSIDEPAPTIRGVNRPVPKGYLGHDGDSVPVESGIRPLTTLERARLQTFPKTFKWSASKTDVEQMIGNAVPVKLAEYIAAAIYRYIGSRQSKAA